MPKPSLALKKLSKLELVVSSPPTFFHSLRDIDPDLHPDLYEVIAGLGGRNITKHSIHDMLDSAQKNELEPLTFLDLDRTLVEAELERQETVRRSGPMAENMLRDVNTRANQAANARNN